MSQSHLSSRTTPASSEATPFVVNPFVGPSPVYQKSSPSKTLNIQVTPLVRRCRSSGGDEALSRFTAADVTVPHLTDEKLDELFPKRDSEDQDLEDDLEDQVVGGASESRNRSVDEVEQQDAEEKPEKKSRR